MFISLGICVVSYFLAVLVWPYALEGIFSNVFNAFLNMNKFEISIRQNFEGIAQWSDDLPWYYSCKYMLITIPIVVLLGFVLSIVFLYKNRKNWFLYSVLLFSTIFPLVWITINNSNVYGGWRHLIFVYLPLVVLASLGISTLIDLIKNKYKINILNYIMLKKENNPQRRKICRTTI